MLLSVVAENKLLVIDTTPVIKNVTSVESVYLKFFVFFANARKSFDAYLKLLVIFLCTPF